MIGTGPRVGIRLATLLLGALLFPACTDEPTSVPTGSWGGEGVVLQVRDDGAVLEDLAGCFEGNIPRRLVVDDAGRFALDGTYVNFPLGSRPGISEPARFTGFVSGDTMSLTITTSASAPIASGLLMRYGVPPSPPTWFC